MSFLFVKEPSQWVLKIQSYEELMEYAEASDLFDKDKEQYKIVKGYRNDDNTAMTHTNFGWFVKNRQNDDFSIDECYDALKLLQFQTMAKILSETGEIYINRRGGFHGKRSEKEYSNFVRRNFLDFPRLYSKDIRIEQFPDGRHYYAYVGDVQVKDGNILKWDNYDEAFSAAKKMVII